MKAYELVYDYEPIIKNNRKRTSGRKVHYQTIINPSNGKVIKTIKHILK